MGSGRVRWHRGATEAVRAAAVPPAYGTCQRAAVQQAPASRSKGLLRAGCASTTQRLRTLLPGARLGFCLRHALLQLLKKRGAIASPGRQSRRARCHPLWSRGRQRTNVRGFAWGQRLRHVVDPVTAAAGAAHRARVRRWGQAKKGGGEAGLEEPRLLATSTLLEQAHNAIARKRCRLTGLHHPDGSPQAGLRGLAPLDHRVPSQRRARHASQWGVEVAGGRVPTAAWFLNLPLLTSGGVR
jgi:hypothetical protein